VVYSKISVAVLGAGHGGLALAGYLADRGHLVALWNRSDERVVPVAERRGILLASKDGHGDLVPIALATSNMAVALSGAQVILVAVPACAHAAVARECAAHLRHGQTVLLLPGRTGGALEFRRVLRESGCHARIVLGEANTFPFAARCVGPASALLYGTKTEVLAAALPASQTPSLLAACRPFLPMLRPARSVLYTGLANLGAILHPVITLLNAKRIEAGEAFDFYCQGVTPAVANTLAAADTERLQVAQAYGVPVCSLRDWIARAYDYHADTLQGAVAGNPSYAGIKAPTTIHHRYLLEDVPTGLVPLQQLGAAAGLVLPVLKGLIQQARITLGEKIWQQERSLARLGLDKLGACEIRSYIERGCTTPLPKSARIPVRRLVSSMELIPQV
jgi:opine dehydrogenase